MALIKPLVKMSAICVYKDGSRTLSTVMEGYRDAVVQHAGETYALEIIDKALLKGHITESEYQETISYSIK